MRSFGEGSPASYILIGRNPADKILSESGFHPAVRKLLSELDNSKSCICEKKR
jgi:hypothetical protein